MYATPSSSRRWSSAASPIASDGDLRETVAAEPRLDGRDDALDQLERDRALDARALEAAQQLRAVERLPAAVALDDPQRRLLDALERREARVAVEALATAADGLAGIAHARLEHARLAIAAGRADHLPAPDLALSAPSARQIQWQAASDGRRRRLNQAGSSGVASAREAARAHAGERGAEPGEQEQRRDAAERDDRQRHLVDVRRAEALEQVRDRAAHADGARRPRRRRRSASARRVAPVARARRASRRAASRR